MKAYVVEKEMQLSDNRIIPQNSIRVAVGTHVSIELVLASESEALEFDIVSDDSADYGRGFLGAGTPLAKAILGKSGGQAVPYEVDDIRAIRILEVTRSITKPPKDVKARREETIRKAVDQSDRTNAVIFASSFSGKWGDYDPTGFTDEEEEKKG